MERIERFCKSIQIDTSWPAGALPGDRNAEAVLTSFQDFLLASYPQFKRAAEHWILSPYGIIFRWPGISSGEKPVLFTAHYDVVPVEEEKWGHAPFGAEQENGFIYGRGSLDMKSLLTSLMEAAEDAVSAGFKPKQDIYFAFGGDEERAGSRGAMNMAKWFLERNIRFSWVFDEGTIVALKQIPWIDKPLALLGIEEKGFVSLELSVDQAPGHASRPPNVQAVAVLAKALVRIAGKPFPFRMTPTVEAFFKKIGEFSPGFLGWALRNVQYTSPLLIRIMKKNPSMASLLHTTLAMTQLEGSKADNVMPSAAKAVMNLRLLNPWTVDSAMEFIRKLVKDERVHIRLSNVSTNPVAANPEYVRGQGPGYGIVQEAIERTFPGVPVLPFLMVATTDSRHYKDISDGIFRFCPQMLDPDELALIHGHNERISLENLDKVFAFYSALLRLL